MSRFIILPDTEEFAFTPTGFDGVTIWYRRLPDDEVEAIERKYRKVDTRHGRREVYIPEERRAEHARELVDKTITRWEGITDAAGTPLPCTEETKARLFTLMPEVREEFLRVRTANIPQPTNGASPNS